MDYRNRIALHHDAMVPLSSATGTQVGQTLEQAAACSLINAFNT